jgi:hypothetical protein
MSEQNEIRPENNLLKQILCVQDIHAEQVTFGPGLAGRINATQDVNVQQGGALVISAGQDAEVAFGGALAIAAGRDMKQENGGGILIAVGRDLQLSDAAAGILNVGGQVAMKDSMGAVVVASSARVEQSMVGVLFSSNADLGEGNKILLSTPQAAALGATFGFVFAVMSWLLRRR